MARTVLRGEKCREAPTYPTRLIDRENALNDLVMRR
jgi:hypothetical protein